MSFKGVHYGQDFQAENTFIDPETGCHFRYQDLTHRLLALKQKRKELDKTLGIPESEEERSPTQQSHTGQFNSTSETTSDKVFVQRDNLINGHSRNRATMLAPQNSQESTGSIQRLSLNYLEQRIMKNHKQMHIPLPLML